MSTAVSCNGAGTGRALELKRALPATPVTVARIERALVLCAYLVARDDAGWVYAPIMDRLEAELTRLREIGDPAARARRLLSSYSTDTNVLALR